MRIISQQSGKVRALKVVQSSRAARVGDYAGHGFLLSPPAKRTDHLLSQPDISCASDTAGRTDVPPSAAIACGQSKTLPALAAAPLFVPSPCTQFTNLRSGFRKKLH